MTTLALAPCPFCGQSDLLFVRYAGNYGGTTLVVRHSVSCDRCNVDLFRPTEAEAIAAWNRRTTGAPK